MTAQEANELTNGSMKKKGPLFKFKLIFSCGLINKMIENAAEEGNHCVIVKLDSTELKKYYPMYKKFYEDLDYSVSSWSVVGVQAAFAISWDPQLKETYACPKCKRRVTPRFFMPENSLWLPAYSLECEYCGERAQGTFLKTLIDRWKIKKE